MTGASGAYAKGWRSELSEGSVRKTSRVVLRRGSEVGTCSASRLGPFGLDRGLPASVWGLGQRCQRAVGRDVGSGTWRPGAIGPARRDSEDALARFAPDLRGGRQRARDVGRAAQRHWARWQPSNVRSHRCGAMLHGATPAARGWHILNCRSAFRCPRGACPMRASAASGWRRVAMTRARCSGEARGPWAMCRAQSIGFGARGSRRAVRLVARGRELTRGAALEG